MEDMVSAFTIYESKVKGYMYSGGFTSSQDVIKEAWQSIITRVISGVCKRNCSQLILTIISAGVYAAISMKGKGSVWY